MRNLAITRAPAEAYGNSEHNGVYFSYPQVISIIPVASRWTSSSFFSFHTEDLLRVNGRLPVAGGAGSDAPPPAIRGRPRATSRTVAAGMAVPLQMPGTFAVGNRS